MTTSTQYYGIIQYKFPQSRKAIKTIFKMLDSSPDKPIDLRPKIEPSSPQRNRSPKDSVFHSVALLATSESKSNANLDTVDGAVVRSPKRKCDGKKCSPPKIQIFNHIHQASSVHYQTPYQVPLIQPSFYYHPYLLMSSHLMTSQIQNNMDVNAFEKNRRLQKQYDTLDDVPNEYQKGHSEHEEPDAFEERKLMKDCEELMPNFCKNRGKGHVCIYCGKLYSRKYGLKIHLRTHTGYKPLKCKVCQRPFGDPSNLNKHIRLHAQGNTPYRCDHCGKVLVRRRDLERHIKSRHPSDVTNSLDVTSDCDVVDTASVKKSSDEDSDVEQYETEVTSSTVYENDDTEKYEEIDVEHV